MHQPKEAHLEVALRIVQYLKRTPGRRILFKWNKSVSLEAYMNADYAESVVDKRSTIGYLVCHEHYSHTYSSKMSTGFSWHFGLE